MTIKDRYDEFLRRANEAARDLKIEVEFTTQTQGAAWMEYEAPCVEIVCTDEDSEFPRYLCIDGRVEIDGKKNHDEER